MNAYLPDLSALSIEDLLPGASCLGSIHSRGWVAARATPESGLLDATDRNTTADFFIRPVRFGYIQLKAESHLAAEETEGYLLICCMHGCGRFGSWSSSMMSIAAGDLIFLCGGEGMTLQADQDMEISLLILTGRLTSELYRAACDQRIGRQPLSAQPPFPHFTRIQFPDYEQRQFVILKKFLTRQGKDADEKAALYDFSCHMDHLLTRLVLLNDPNTGEAPGKTLIMQILTYLQEHFREDLTVEEVAAHFGFSVSHFRRIFREEMHIAPKPYLTQLRMHYAAGELLGTDHSIEKIAQDSGFHNAAHFASTFRNAYNMSPLQYRSRMTMQQAGPESKTGEELLYASKTET